MKPIIAFIGVRMSWDILLRNAVFATFALFASTGALAGSILSVFFSDR